MSWLVKGRLVNGLFSNHWLRVEIRHGPRALHFDLGDMSALPTREMMRVSDVVVTHWQADHFMCVDLLLRLRLNRLGPPSFVEG